LTADLERLEQQRLITESADAYARRELEPGHLRQKDFSRERWQKLASLGLLATLLPEQIDGLGLKLGDVVPSIEALGSKLLREPFVAACILPSFILGATCDGEQGAELAGKLGQGELVPAVAWQEGTWTFAQPHVATVAQSAAGGFLLNGRKEFVLPGDKFDGLIVSAMMNARTALFWLDGSEDGLVIERRPTADGGEVASVVLSNVKVSGERLLHSDGAETLTRALSAATICASAELLGLIRGAISMTLEYLRTRKQFDRTIGSFQALQHRAADLYIQQELCAAALRRAVEDFEEAQNIADMLKAASRAKYRCSVTALRVTKEAVQMHGGIGYTNEHDIGLYLKRALTLSSWLGNAAEHRRCFANLAFGGPQ